MTPRSAALASLTIFCAQVSINLGAALGKTLFPQVGPEGVAAMRTCIAALILLAVACPWRQMPSLAQIKWLALYGLALGGMNLLIYWSFERIPIGVAVAVEICGPVTLVLLLSRSASDFLWLGLTLAGLLLLVPWPGSASTLDPLGMLFALGAAACWALYIVFGKRASEVDSKVAVSLGMVVACFVTVPFGWSAAGHALLDYRIMALGLAVAVLSSALPYFLEMKALVRLSSRVFGVVTSAAPASAAIVGFVVLGEELSFRQWLAIALMIAASAGCSLTSRPPVSRPREDVMS